MNARVRELADGDNESVGRKRDQINQSAVFFPQASSSILFHFNNFPIPFSVFTYYAACFRAR